MQILDPSGHPMMSDKEVEIIDNLLERKRSKLCLEWGSGNSTVYFPNKHDCIERWDAVEHKIDYLELLGDKLKKGVAKIHIVKDYTNYVGFPLSTGIKYDFIFIDGLMRQSCLEMALHHVLNLGATILLHDPFRYDHADIIKAYQGQFEILSQGEKPGRDGFFAHRGLILFKV